MGIKRVHVRVNALHVHRSFDSILSGVSAPRAAAAMLKRTTRAQAACRQVPSFPSFPMQQTSGLAHAATCDADLTVGITAAPFQSR